MSTNMDTRYGAIVSKWRKFATESGADMTAPTTELQCAACEGRQVEWLVYKPSAVTVYTFHHGTWVTGEMGLDAWVEMGSVASGTVASDAAYKRHGPFTVNGDKVAAFVDTITGTEAANWKFWYRVIG